MCSGEAGKRPTGAAQADPQFLTSREELFQRLCLRVPSGWAETEGRFGPGRVYYKRVGDLLDALQDFCDEKERVPEAVGRGAHPGVQP